MHRAGSLPEFYSRYARVCLWKIPTQESPYPLWCNRNPCRLSGASSQSACKPLLHLCMLLFLWKIIIKRFFSSFTGLYSEVNAPFNCEVEWAEGWRQGSLSTARGEMKTLLVQGLNFYFWKYSMYSYMSKHVWIWWNTQLIDTKWYILFPYLFWSRYETIRTVELGIV